MTELDLSALPEALRRKLETQLARLPMELRETMETQMARLPPEKLAELLERGSPMLDRFVAKADKARDKVSDKAPKLNIGQSAIAGRENRTVQAGDTPGALGKILLAIAVAAAVYYALF